MCDSGTHAAFVLLSIHRYVRRTRPYTFVIGILEFSRSERNQPVTERTQYYRIVLLHLNTIYDVAPLRMYSEYSQRMHVNQNDVHGSSTAHTVCPPLFRVPFVYVKSLVVFWVHGKWCHVVTLREWQVATTLIEDQYFQHKDGCPRVSMIRRSIDNCRQLNASAPSLLRSPFSSLSISCGRVQIAPKPNSTEIILVSDFDFIIQYIVPNLSRGDDTEWNLSCPVRHL